MGRAGLLRALIAFTLVAGTMALFRPALNNDFVNFDDPDYVTANSMVRKGLDAQSMQEAFRGFHFYNWQPLTFLSHMLDVELFGLRPYGHHFTSVVLHALNALLFFLALDAMTGALWRSAFVAALFAVHPLHVEDVAWIASRKDVLSTLFWTLGMGAYIRYVRRPGTAWYLATAAALAAGLMAKPMLVTFPVALLLLDFWPLGRTGRGGSAARPGTESISPTVWPLIVEKLPLFALALAGALAAYLGQEAGGAVSSLERYPLGVRIMNALTAYAGYLGKTLWPTDLAALYPHRGSAISALTAAGAAFLLSGITLLGFRSVRRKPYLLTGWLWFIATLVPVIGLVQIGQHAMADRFTYIPLVGLFMAGTWELAHRASRWRWGGGIAVALSAAILLALAPITLAQIAHWRDGVALFAHALEVTGGNETIHNNLATALSSKGQTEKAIPHFLQAISLNPGKASYHFNLANALNDLGRLEAAEQAYRRALALRKSYPEAQLNLAVVLVRNGRPEEAIQQLEHALQLDPREGKLHYNLALILKHQGRGEEAILHFRQALEVNPDLEPARRELAHGQP